MYHCLSAIAPIPSAADPEQEGHHHAHDLIGDRKNTDAIATITNTIAVVTAVSRRVGQVTFCASARTSCMNLKGLIFAMVYLPLTAVRGSIVRISSIYSTKRR